MMKAMREKTFFFLFFSCIGFLMGVLMSFFIDLRSYSFHGIHLIPLMFLLKANVDLKNHEILDEILIYNVIGFLLGFMLLGLDHYFSFILAIGLESYLLIMSAYFYITYVINIIIKSFKD